MLTRSKFLRNIIKVRVPVLTQRKRCNVMKNNLMRISISKFQRRLV